MSSTGRRNAAWSVTLKVGTDNWIGLGGAAVVAEARAERVPERRLAQDLEVEHQANQAYEAYRKAGVMKDGRRFGGPPKPYSRRPSRRGRSI